MTRPDVMVTVLGLAMVLAGGTAVVIAARAWFRAGPASEPVRFERSAR